MPQSLEDLKCLEISPFQFIAKDSEVIHSKIRPLKCELKPVSFRTSVKKPYSTISYVFSRSTLRTKAPFRPFLLASVCRTSLAMIILSIVNLLVMKLDWYILVSFGITDLSLFAKTFVTTFIRTSHSNIGQN